MSVCLFVCSTITPEALEASSRNFQGIMLGSKGRRNSTIYIAGCAANDLTSDVVLCNVVAAWQMMVKELTRTVTDRCAGGVTTSPKYSSLLVNVMIVTNNRVRG